MNFTQAIAAGFWNYVNFSGRALRSEYWFWTLFCSIVGVATAILDLVTGFQITNPVFSLATLLPSLAGRGAAAARHRPHRLVAVAGLDRNWHFCAARVVLLQGHVRSEPVRPRSAGVPRRRIGAGLARSNRNFGVTTRRGRASMRMRARTH